MSAEEIAKAFVQHYYQSRGMLFASFSRGLSGCLGCLDAPCRVISLRCERLGGYGRLPEVCSSTVGELLV